MECKYNPMQSKSIAEAIMGTHAFPFTLFLLQGCHCLWTIYSCIFYYVEQFITDSQFSKHLLTFIKFYLQGPNTRNLCFIPYQGIPMKSNNIFQLRSC